MRYVLAVIAGVVLGGIVNMALIMISGHVIAPPEGVDPSDPESLKANIHLFEFRHFIFPLVAHGLGTLVGAAVAARIAPRHGMGFALGVGAFYLLGGIAAASMIGGPTWFIVVDLVACYIPMAWFGAKLFGGSNDVDSDAPAAAEPS